MSLMVAYRGGALYLGQGPSFSPQGPHTAAPSLPLWHPSSTGESLGMREHGAGDAWGHGAVGGLGTGGGKQAQEGLPWEMVRLGQTALYQKEGSHWVWDAGVGS